MEEAARVAGHARWLEDRLFSVLGGWVAVEADAAAKAAFSAHSLRHAWHAQVWADRLPRVAHLDPDALTVPAGPEVGALVDELAALRGVDATTDRLDGSRRLLGGLVAAYRHRLERAHPLADGPTVRWVGFVVVDEVAALDELTALMLRRGGGGLRDPDLTARDLVGLPAPSGYEML